MQIVFWSVFAALVIAAGILGWIYGRSKRRR
jgi:hypothetical protein